MFDFGKLWSTKGSRDDTPALRPSAGPPLRRDLPITAEPRVDVWPEAEANATQTRNAERFVPRRTNTSLTTAKGRRVDGRIVNISAAGVAVEVNLAQLGGDPVIMVGSRPVEKGRPMALGMVFLFVKPIDPALCNPDIIL